MSILDLVDYVQQQAKVKKINDSELARRCDISRPALLKLLGGKVKCPEITTITNLAYAIDDHPFRLVSLYLAGISPPTRDEWKLRDKKDASRFIRDVTYPDGTIVQPGERFKKIWEIANGGDFPWVGRKLICQDHRVQLYQKIAIAMQCFFSFSLKTIFALWVATINLNCIILSGNQHMTTNNALPKTLYLF